MEGAEVRLAPRSAALPRLPRVAVLEFTVAFRRTGRIAEFRGAAYRGAFGHALRAVACVRGGGCGAACRAPRECVVSHLFERPPLPLEILRLRYADPPHPIALRAPAPGDDEVHRGQLETFGWMVLEPAWHWLPVLHRAVTWMGDTGLGAQRVPFEVVRSQYVLGDGSRRHAPAGDVRPPEHVPESFPPGDLRVRLETPLRFQNQGRVSVRWDTGEFVRSVVRRVWRLAEFYGAEERLAPDPSNFGIEARDVSVRFVHRNRFSSRQDRNVPWGGFQGSLTLVGVSPEFASLLAWARVLQIGKGTTMGLGRFTVVGDTK